MLLTFSTGSIKSNADDVVRIEKGTPAPYTGVLMPDSTATQLRDAVIERDGYKLLNESLTKSIDFYKENDKLNEEKAQILLKRNNELASTLKETRDFNSTQRTIWFILGIAVTGIALYGVKSLSDK